MAGDIVGQAPEIEVRITATVGREFERLDVFPKLRYDHARGVISGPPVALVFLVTVNEAEALLTYLGDQLAAPARFTLPRGVPVAFESLRKSLRKSLQAEVAAQAQFGSDWRKKAAEAEARVKRATDELSDLPSTNTEFAKRAADLFWSGMNAVEPYLRREPGDAGYCFNAADRERFVELAASLYWEIRRARPQFNAARRFSKVTAARAEAAKVNVPLQRMLAAAAACPLPPEPEDEGQQAA